MARGGAVAKAINDASLAGPILAMNGDTYFPVDLGRLTDFHQKAALHLSIAAFETNDGDRYTRMVVSADGRVNNLSVGCRDGLGLANGGVYLIEINAILSALPGAEKFSLEADFLPTFISGGGRVYAQKFDEIFIDIGVPEDYLRAQQIIGKP